MEQVRLLGGRYELGGVLGRGATAEVVRGWDLREGRPVAVKLLRPDLAHDPTLRDRFRREVGSAASLHHPSIVAVHDSGEWPLDGVGVPYMVMEYVNGQTLRDLLGAVGRVPPDQALEIIVDTLGALDFSHRRGIVHRDVKPGNLMLPETGGVKLMDWGIARCIGAPGSTGMGSAALADETIGVAGTPQYLSPEQAKGEAVDSRSDLYSVGCVLYELVTGRPPFTGEVPVSVAYQHVRANPTPPAELESAVTPAMDRIILRSLAKVPDLRYQSAAGMRDDIERCLTKNPAPLPSTDRVSA